MRRGMGYGLVARLELTSRVQDAITATENLVTTSAWILPNQISMKPYSRKLFKVCSSVPRLSTITPKANRHAEEGSGDYQVSGLTRIFYVPALAVPYLHFHAKVLHGDLARIYVDYMAARHDCEAMMLASIKHD
jgi:hypothetical protein